LKGTTIISYGITFPINNYSVSRFWRFTGAFFDRFVLKSIFALNIVRIISAWLMRRRRRRITSTLLLF